MLVCELLERQEDFRFIRLACRSRVSLKKSVNDEDPTTTDKKKQSH